MARPPTPLHRLVLREKKGRAVCWWRGREWAFGPWDARAKAPHPDAAAAFARQLGVWRTDPAAGIAGCEGELLADVWADWREAAPSAGGGEVRTTALLLFGTADAPGPHLATEATAFGLPQMAAWQATLCGLEAAGKARRRYSRESVRRHVRTVWACLLWAAERDRIPHEQYAACRLVAPPRKGEVREKAKRSAVPRERVAAVLPHLSPPLAAVADLLWWTGARPSEVLTLTRGDVRTGGTLLTPAGVRLDLDALGVWAAVKDEHKTEGGDYERVVFFGPRARAAITPFLDRPPSSFLFRPVEGRAWWAARMSARRTPGGYGSYKRVKGEAGEVRPGERYGYRALGEAVERACKLAGVPHWTPYSARHSAGRLVQAQFGRDGARVWLGHMVGGVTEIYTGADLTLAARIAADMG